MDTTVTLAYDLTFLKLLMLAYDLTFFKLKMLACDWTFSKQSLYSPPINDDINSSFLPSMHIATIPKHVLSNQRRAYVCTQCLSQYLAFESGRSGYLTLRWRYLTSTVLTAILHLWPDYVSKYIINRPESEL